MKDALLVSAGLLVALSSGAMASTSPPPLAPESALHRVHEGHMSATAASGVVNAVDATRRKVNVSHGSIKSLGWPAMTMDFPVNQGVDLATIKAGMKVNFTLVKSANGTWTVDTLKPVEN